MTNTILSLNSQSMREKTNTVHVVGILLTAQIIIWRFALTSDKLRECIVTLCAVINLLGKDHQLFSSRMNL